jgi:L-arabinokinase
MGASSSAALEIATLRALAQLAKVRFRGTQLAHLGQRAENRMVGAPCGLMDQLASAFGKSGHLLPILCRPDQLQNPIRIPKGLIVVGWSSGIKHSVRASPYATARTASFMGKALLEHQFKRRWNFVSEITPSFFENRAKPHLSERMSGCKYLKSGLALADLLSKVDQRIRYPVRAAVEFPMEENFRCGLVHCDP